MIAPTETPRDAVAARLSPATRCRARDRTRDLPPCLHRPRRPLVLSRTATSAREPASNGRRRLCQLHHSRSRSPTSRSRLFVYAFRRSRDPLALARRSGAYDFRHVGRRRPAPAASPPARKVAARGRCGCDRRQQSSRTGGDPGKAREHERQDGGQDERQRIARLRRVYGGELSSSWYLFSCCAVVGVVVRVC